MEEKTPTTNIIVNPKFTSPSFAVRIEMLINSINDAVYSNNKTIRESSMMIAMSMETLLKEKTK